MPRYLLCSTFFILAVIPAIFVLPCCAESNVEVLNERSVQYNDIVIQEVVNADTCILESGETIRLIGVRALGSPARRKPVHRDQHGFVIEEKPGVEVPIEERAVQFVRDLLEGRHVRLEFDAAPKDEQYRTLAYVFLIEGDVFVNAEILRQGFGDLRIQSPNLKYAAELREAYRESSAYRRGMDE